MVSTIATLCKGSTSEFAGANHQRGFQKPPGFQVIQQRCNRLIDNLGVLAMTGLKVVVVVPGRDKANPFDTRDFNESNSPFDKSSSQQAFLGVLGHQRVGRIDPVTRQGLLGLVGKLDQFRYGALHRVCGLVVANRGLDELISSGCRIVFLEESQILALQVLQKRLLLLDRSRGLDVSHNLSPAETVEDRTLMDCGQEGTRKVLRATDR